ncbi:MAG: hypothetical protein LUH22_03545 [Bacteroides sp.]|nr:hypothetical protein [Bacteroides sp.]
MNLEDKYIDIIEKTYSTEENEEELRNELYDLDKDEFNQKHKEEVMYVPHEYDCIVEQITNALYSGFDCYLNPETLEIEQASNLGYIAFTEAEYSEQNEDLIDEFGLSYPEWDSYIRFEPFSRNDLLNRMESFVSQLNDQDLKTQLENLSNKEEYIREFNGIMERTGHLEEWNTFRKKEIENYVKNQLMRGLQINTDTEEDVYSLSE